MGTSTEAMKCSVCLSDEKEVQEAVRDKGWCSAGPSLPGHGLTCRLSTGVDEALSCCGRSRSKNHLTVSNVKQYHSKLMDELNRHTVISGL